MCKAGRKVSITNAAAPFKESRRADQMPGGSVGRESMINFRDLREQISRSSVRYLFLAGDFDKAALDQFMIGFFGISLRSLSGGGTPNLGGLENLRKLRLGGSKMNNHQRERLNAALATHDIVLEIDDGYRAG